MTVPGWLAPLAAALPGVRAEQFPTRRPPTTARRRSAVLVALGCGPDGPDLLLIRRAVTLRSHPGQAAFPGGEVDPADDGPVGAALREAAEEVGLAPGSVEVLAVLPQLWLAASAFLVTPVVAWWRDPHEVAPVDPAEVAAVARVPVAELSDPANRFRVGLPGGWVGPAFDVRGMLVWGFTAVLTDRLLALGGWERPWDTSRVLELDAQTLAPTRAALEDR